ncbi:MAG: excinuclease ABC subunit UvrA [Candidatus Hydrogenedentota bacterium]|nr:MAG: excinuclease ABC subunit UvrA [Candidatus Hydrogenedentota bacterium]
MRPEICIRGARLHNLRNINVSIPVESLTVITGLSGSGKSSLAFDTLYAEGQRRYVESLSTYARQFLGQMDRADVDEIEGLSPAIAIEQRSTQRNPRSTVGTVTEIYDHLRLLWARLGIPHCPKCDTEVRALPTDRIVETIQQQFSGRKVVILAPIAVAKKGEFRKEKAQFLAEGFLRVRVDGEILLLEQMPPLKRNQRHDVELVIDRLHVEEGKRERLAEAVESALEHGNGTVTVLSEVQGRSIVPTTYSNRNACTRCGIGLSPLEPRTFSFNSPHGACPRCSGIGYSFAVDPERILGNPEKSIREGVILPWGEKPERKWYGRSLRRVCAREGFSLNVPWKRIPERAREIILFGYSEEEAEPKFFRFEGVIPFLERRYNETSSIGIRRWIERFMTMKTCPACSGERLNPEARLVRVKGKRLPEVLKWTVEELKGWLEELSLDEREMRIGERVLDEVRSRLMFLSNVGLSYMTLDRSAASLSGGEAQRIRLATQLGSKLRGVLYVLDEPSIGLHPEDTARLMQTLKDLRDLGNTVVVVEHDLDMIRQADHVIDLGPGAGRHGGEVVAVGTPAQVEKHPTSLTALYLRGERRINGKPARAVNEKEVLVITGVSTNNLKSIDVKIPLKRFVCVTGVSGSGKSSLVMDTLFPALKRHFGMRGAVPGPFKRLLGTEHIRGVIGIDQSPIGRSSRSNPATYTGVWTPIRELFSLTKESRSRGYKPGRFSFNVAGGRCDSCEGAGIKTVEMQFLPDVHITCEVCGGRRFNQETLEVKYRGKSIADILDMTVEEATEFFRNHPRIQRGLAMLKEVGLGYLHLGQPAPALSGGEAQRLKLAAELGRSTFGSVLYVLDEPTVGLHMEDVRILLDVLDRLVDRGDTVLVVEHHPDVIAHADTIIDLGPGSGQDGGRIVAWGSPEEIAGIAESATGRVLARRKPSEKPRRKRRQI